MTADLISITPTGHISTPLRICSTGRVKGFLFPSTSASTLGEEENVDQLFDDLLLGVVEMAGEDGETATTFLGTTIFVSATDKSETVRQGEERAQPAEVLLVIDGQQRISTIALLAIRLTARLRHLAKELEGEGAEPYVVLLDHCSDTIKALKKLYTVEPGRGARPRHKPKIIRAAEDRWTHKGDDSCYRSPVSQYIARYIRVWNDGAGLECLPVCAGRVRANVLLIDRWLNHIANAHIPSSDLYGHFPVGTEIASARVQEDVLGFRNDVVAHTVVNGGEGINGVTYNATALYHLFVLTYYLLRRCVVNRLYPAREDWGFDMFQALNATGTPLTAMETFLPQAMLAERTEGNDWASTPSAVSFAEIDKLFEKTSSNQAKNKRTNELLGAFRLCHDGEKLANRFSAQRRWMTHCYEKEAEGISERRQYVDNLAGVAKFYRAAWYMEDASDANVVDGLDEHSEGELASLAVTISERC